MNIEISENIVTIDGVKYYKPQEDCNILTIGGIEYHKKQEPESNEDELVGRLWIADYIGCSRSNLSTHPWHLPDWGEKKGRKFKKSEAIEFLSIPNNKRKQMYKEYKENKKHANNKQIESTPTASEPSTTASEQSSDISE